MWVNLTNICQFIHIRLRLTTSLSNIYFNEKTYKMNHFNFEMENLIQLPEFHAQSDQHLNRVLHNVNISS